MLSFSIIRQMSQNRSLTNFQLLKRYLCCLWIDLDVFYRFCHLEFDKKAISLGVKMLDMELVLFKEYKNEKYFFKYYIRNEKNIKLKLHICIKFLVFLLKRIQVRSKKRKEDFHYFYFNNIFFLQMSHLIYEQLKIFGGLSA